MQVPAGSIYGFLGPNGSGKTTLIKLLLGLLKQKRGRILLFQKDIAYCRIPILQKVGSLIESPSLYHHLTGIENLEVCRLAYDTPTNRIHEALSLVQLQDAGKTKVNAYSFGMKQRLGIAIALLHDPDIIILDEPLNGLDPLGIATIRNLIKMLHTDHGKTIFLSSHLLDEVEKVATHVGILHKGSLIFQGGMDELRKLYPGENSLESLFMNLTYTP